MHAMLSPNLALNISLKLADNSIPEPKISAGTRGLRVVNMNNSMLCNQIHAKQIDESMLSNLAEHQMHVKGAHKCCQCAYNSGYQQGALLQKFISLDIESLGDSHAGAEGHYKSIHQAFALGYSDGVNSFIRS
jgi:hypothetical protein